MQDVNMNNAPQVQEDDELMIDWTGILSKLLKHWKQIVLIGFIFGAIGIVSALTMKRIYNVTLTLAPEVQSRGSGSLSSMAAMLGIGGLQMSPSTDAMNITLFPEICNSTPFLAGLLDVPLTSYVSGKMKEEGVQPKQTTVYKHFSGEDIERKGLAKWRYERARRKHPEKPYTGVADPTELTRKQDLVVKGLRRSISANVDKKTGITTMFMDAGLDTGDMLLKQEIEISDDMTLEELHDALMGMGAEVLQKTLEQLSDGTLKREPQIDEDSNYAPMIGKETGRIDWEKPAKEIHDLVRGLNSWPGAYTFLKGSKYKIWRTRVLDERPEGAPGTVLRADKSGFVAATGDGSLEILEMQAPGGKKMKARDYLLGHGIELPARFER